jgi:threonine synthase
VPKAIGDFLILDALRKSNGTAVAVSDEELISAVKKSARRKACFALPKAQLACPLCGN